MEKTLIILKPDTVMRGLMGKVLSRFEEKGFKFLGLKMLKIDRAKAEELYSPHLGQPFYPPLIDFITSGPIVVAVLTGIEVIPQVRNLMGKTSPAEATPGSIRCDFGQRMQRNIIHGSDCPDSAKREIALFFSEEELLDYRLPVETWL